MALEIEHLPARLGRYDVRGKIGEGGMAVIYLGRARSDAPADRRLVALKAIKNAYTMNTEYLAMFADEAKIVERLDHPSIVRVFELAAEGPRLFMAMEFLDGQSLWQLWAACRERGIRLRYDIIAYIGARIAEGLHHAHELRDERGAELLQLVHRDVNPANIFLTYDGAVKLIDFGLAWAKNRVKSRAGIVKGKLAYLSPEQATGAPVDRRTDVFALCVTLWELSTDRRLFRVEDDAETVERVVACDVPSPLELVDGYPAELWDILRRGLGREPSQRYSTAADLALALDAFVRKQPEPITPAMIADILSALFPEEKEKSASWLRQAAVGRAPALATLRPRDEDSSFDMPDVPGPPSVPFDLPLGDFAPPSLPVLPGNEYDPLGASGVQAAAPSSSVPFELIEPVPPSSEGPRSVQLVAAPLAAPPPGAAAAAPRGPRSLLTVGAVSFVAAVLLWFLLSR